MILSQVRVVQHKGTKQVYALKYINKAKCIQMSAVDNIIEERKLLEVINNNFIWYEISNVVICVTPSKTTKIYSW
jgi:serine/threonine protein kinase